MKLLVEDDEKIASFVVKGLRQSGCAMDHCADGEAGLARLCRAAHDAAVVEPMLPKLDGLSLVKAVVETHQGSVAVKSQVGEGSEFTVRLPRLE
jgi:two-component system OmpR family response regulator